MTRLVIADDHVIFRQGLRSLFKDVEDIEVVAEAGDGETALRLTRELLPDVVVMDIAMPGMNGLEATKLITEEFPSVQVLALSMESSRQFIVEILKAGASGYLTKDTAVAELTTAIRTVAAGEIYLPPKISNLLLKEYLRRVPDTEVPAYDTLTTREREVLQMLAEGKNTKEIALAFDISQKTVDNHRNSIMKKLDLYSIAELTKFAIREGLSSLK